MWWLNCKPVDVIAMITIIGGMVLIGFGKDGHILDILAIVTAYYFGLKSNLPSPPEA